MNRISIVDRIANAAACLSGAYGAVVERSRACGCSRQAVYDQGRRVYAAVAAAGGPGAEDRRAERLDRLRRENDELRARLGRSVEFGRDRQTRFVAAAAAMGVGVRQVRDLLGLILGESAAPSRSTVGRWAAAAGEAAGRALARLDDRCRGLIKVGCLDEIFFHGRAVLMVVEPASLTWAVGRRVEALNGEAWSRRLRDFPELGDAVADAGRPLQAGLTRARHERARLGRPPLHSSLDVFHTKHQANKALAIAWNRVRRDFDAYEAARGRLERARRGGTPSHAEGSRAAAAWRAVEASFAEHEAMATAWAAIAEALEVRRPDGRLNDRAWAEARVAEHLPALRGRAWKPVVGHLRDPSSFTFLDRLHARIQDLPIPPSLREPLLDLLRLRRPRRRDDPPHPAAPIRAVVCSRLDPDWPRWAREVERIIRTTVRASSAVECMNSVLRMHQSRHRNVTQRMLDLKRLHWNTRRFRRGKRKGRRPYEHLGLALPTYDFWELLKQDFDDALAEAKAAAARKARSRLIAKLAAA